MEQIDKTKIALNIKIELTPLIAIFDEVENLFLEKSIWPNIFKRIEILSYTVPKEWFEVECEKLGVEYGCEDKTFLDPFDEKIYLRFLNITELSFLWYRDGYSDHLMDSQAIDYKEALIGRQPKFFLFLVFYFIYLSILCESFMGLSFL